MMTLSKRIVAVGVSLIMALSLALGYCPFYSVSAAYADSASENILEKEQFSDSGLESQVQDDVSSGNTNLTNMSEIDTSVGQTIVDENVETNTEEVQEPEWDNANSWRYENGQLISNPNTNDNESEIALLDDCTAPTWNKSLGSSYNYTRNGSTINVPINGVKAIGVDVSSWQGDIDWAKVKADGINYAILRIRSYSTSTGTSKIDSQFINNVQGCIENNIPFGVYIYSYASSTAGAENEANLVLSYLSQAGLNPSSMCLPVYYDLEENSMASTSYSSLLGQMATVFCNKIQNAGYQVGIYANANWWNTYLTDSAFNNSSWHRWAARYPYGGTSSNVSNTEIWQFSSGGTVNGISGSVDMNFSYADIAELSNNYQIGYSSHVSNIGWQVMASDGNTSGLIDSEEQMEAIKIKLTDRIDGSIEYRTSVQGTWESSWQTGYKESGTTGESKYIDALQIKLTGEAENIYDVYYRSYIKGIGWLGWAKNGESSGTLNYNLPIQAYQIQLVDKGSSAPGSTKNSYLEYGTPVISYATHVQNIGWQDNVFDGDISGTSGKSLRLEGIKLNVSGVALTGGITYQTHIQDIGWQEWKSDGSMSGTSGQSKRLEAIRIKLTEQLAESYDVYYRVHAQNIGWMGWAKNGQSAGTAGYSYRLEAIQVVLVLKGETIPDNVNALASEDYAEPYKNADGGLGSVNYTTHVQNVGWQSYVSDGDMAGTSGQSLRLEGIKINLGDRLTDYGLIGGSIQYCTHVQNIGWQDWVINNALSGTSGKSLRLEAIKIKLTGDIANQYDVYYRVHAENIGWMGWAKNGEKAGTAGYSYRLEGIQIVLVKKDEEGTSSSPGITYKNISQTVSEAFIEE